MIGRHNAMVEGSFSITILRRLRLSMGPHNSFAEHGANRATSDPNSSRGAREIGVRCRERPGYWVVLFAALAACGGKDSQQIKKEQSLGRRLAEIAGQANQAAPTNVDPDTRLDGAKAGPGLKLTSMYTLVNAESNGVNSTTFEAKLAPIIERASCDNPELRPLIDQGVVVVLEYRGNQGNPIGTLSLNRDTCGALK
jgi:hypothetical protein